MPTDADRNDENPFNLIAPTVAPKERDEEDAPPANEITLKASGEIAPVEDPEALKEQVVEALKDVHDPEIPVNIYELGLIYELDVTPGGAVDVKMTLTSPGCPVAGSMPGTVAEKVRDVAGVSEVHVELVWDPPWNMGMMSEAAMLELGLM